MHSFGRVARRKSIVTLTRTTNPSFLALRALHVRGPGVRCRAAPGTQGPLVKLLVEGFHSPHGMHRLVEWRDRKSIVTLLTPTHQFSSPAPLHVRGPSEMQGCPSTRAL
jgi:hypothetical protein